MSDINQMMIKEINAAIDEGKSALVHEEISIAELEKKLLEKRVYLTIGHTVLAALIAKRDELLADQAPSPPTPEPAEALPVAGNSHESRSPKMPEGRVVKKREELAQASSPPTSPEHAHLVAGNVYAFWVDHDEDPK